MNSRSSNSSQLHQECALLNFDDAGLILSALAEGENVGNNGSGKRSRDELELNDITCNEIKRLRQIMAMEPTHTRTDVATTTATSNVMGKAAPTAAEAQKNAHKPCAPYFYYKDYSLHSDPSPETPLTLPGRIPSFPVKMHAILSRPDLADIVSWMPHGRSWRVWKPREFEVKVIPTYFEHNKFSSFIRQANGWGFRRITTKGPDRNSYYHELFLQGVPHLAKMMQRPSANQKPVSDASTEPNFYGIADDRPLPHQQGSMKDECFEDQANSILAQCTIVHQAHTFSGQLITGSDDGPVKQEAESLTACRDAAVSAATADNKLQSIDFHDFEPLPLCASSASQMQQQQPQAQQQHQLVAVAPAAPQPMMVVPVAAAASQPVAAPQLARRAPTASRPVSASAMLQYANRRLKYNTTRQSFASSLSTTPNVLYYGNHTFLLGPEQKDTKSAAMPHTAMSAPAELEQPHQQMQKAPSTTDFPEPTMITSMGGEDTLTSDDLATLYEDSIDFWAL